MSESNDYKELSVRLIERWQKENLKLNTGATEQELLAFEAHYALTLPEDFRYFYSLVNGMYDWDMDQLSFSLWPLARIQENIGAVSTIQDGILFSIEIIFGDYLINCWQYMLATNDRLNYFVQVTHEKSEIVAENFTEFLSKYLSMPDKIHLF